MTDLLFIPDFLVAGSSARENAAAEGRRLLALNPPAKVASLKERRLSPTKREKTRAKKAKDTIVRNQLVQLGHSQGFVKAVSIAKAKRLIAAWTDGNFIPEHMA